MQPFTIACCQVRAYDIEDAETNLQGLIAALDEAGRGGAKLVLLPECAYPAYYVKDANPYARPGVRPYAEVTALFGAKAREYGFWLAAGMAVPHENGTLTNSGVVFSPDGEIAGRYDKSFLWHFDTTWFERGREFPVFDAEFCRFGVLICADGRQPEVARMLRVNGAEVICDLTAWVSWGRSEAELTTTQCEYLMPVRAFENGVWVAAADKWGPEDQTIIYAGRSCVIGPDGNSRASAPSTGNTVLLYEVTPERVETIPRRPALYGALTRPTESLEAMRIETEALVPGQSAGRVAVVPGVDGLDLSETTRRFEALRAQDCDVVVFSGSRGPEGWEVGIGELEASVRANGGVAVLAVETTGCNWRQTIVAVTPERTYEHLATHGFGIETGENTAPIIRTPAGNLGLLCGDEGYVPEVARGLALEGADILAWALFDAGPMAERVARCRSDESRVYTAAAWPDGGVICSPEGSVMTAVPAGTGVAMAAGTNRAFSRWKERAPGTHVIRDRVPDAYTALTR